MLFSKVDGEADYTFEDLGYDDCGGREVAGPRENAGVSHGEDKSGILHDEGDEGDIFGGDAVDGGR
jgi:hypothetical protein